MFNVAAKHLWTVSMMLVPVCVALSLIYWFPPSEYDFYPKCVLYQWTGLHCPGCGGTRAAHHLVHGRFFDACRMNIFTTVFLPLLISVLVWQKVVMDREKPFLTLSASPRLQWIIGMSVIVFGIARNFPWPPFCWLAPH